MKNRKDWECERPWSGDGGWEREESVCAQIESREEIGNINQKSTQSLGSKLDQQWVGNPNLGIQWGLSVNLGSFLDQQSDIVLCNNLLLHLNLVASLLWSRVSAPIYECSPPVVPHHPLPHDIWAHETWIIGSDIVRLLWDYVRRMGSPASE